jgi:hypothetical protein
MRNPPNFVVWVVLARDYENHGGDFMPYPFGGHSIGYASRKEANRALQLLRVHLGRGRCYVQQYGPYS